MAYFHLKLVSPRPTFPMDASEAEGKAMAEHTAYWQKQVDAGVALVVGPIFDAEGPYGMAVVDLPDESAVQSIVDADPIITSGLGFRFVVSPIPSLLVRK